MTKTYDIFEEAIDGAGESAADESLRLERIMQESDLQRHSTVISQLYRVHVLMCLKVPHMHLMAIV